MSSRRNILGILVATGVFSLGTTVQGSSDRTMINYINGKHEAAALDALLVIHKDGQSEEKMAADRKDAQRYAVKVAKYDPLKSDPADPGTPLARQAYLLAVKSYLVDQGYSVRLNPDFEFALAARLF
jgi:hypothetical protein